MSPGRPEHRPEPRTDRRWHARAWRRMRRRPWRALSITLLTALALLHTAGLWTQPLLNQLDTVLYDQRLRLAMPDTPDGRVVIIDIDERSLARLGQWPWGRERVAQLVDELTQRQQVAALGLDVVFAEADRGALLAPLRELAQGELADHPAFGEWLWRHGAALDPDATLARALARGPVVLGYYLSSDRDGDRSGVLPPPLAGLSPVPPGLLHWDGYATSIAPLAAAADAGFINAITERDGRVRAVPLVAAVDGQLYPSLALAVLRAGLGQPPLALQRRLGQPGGPVSALQLGGAGGLRVPLDARGAALVPYRGAGGVHGGSFRYISALDVIEGRLPDASLRGRYALLGSSTPGLPDLRPTPVGEAVPGVEVHAHLISGMLDGRVPAQPEHVVLLQLLALSALGLGLLTGLTLMSVGNALLLGAGLIGVAIGLNLLLFTRFGWVLPLAPALVLIAASVAANTVIGYLFESRARRRLAAQFATYVPPELVRQMMEAPQRYDMSARTEQLSVMFCDLHGFTALAEQLPPLEVQALLNELLSRFTQVIHAHGGTIDKYMGDSVMAFWGAPLPQPDHARRAVDAALGIVASLDGLNQRRAAAGQPLLAVSIGIHSGLMSVGNMGSDVRRAYTVVGDVVNLAARLEPLARIYGVNLVASQATLQQAASAGHAWQELDDVRVRGRHESVRIHTVRAPAGAADPALAAELAEWQQALADWRAAQFGACAERLTVLREQHPKFPLYALYAERVAECLRSPPGPTSP